MELASEPRTVTVDTTLDHSRLPDVGGRVPRRGNGLSRRFFRGLMALFGWRVVGELPDISKMLFVGAPHTSNADFFMTALTMFNLGVDLHFVMKHTVFKGLIGAVLRFLGGIALDRDQTRDFVRQMVDKFNERESLLLAIMPEGTRSVVPGWRSGFYYIARGADVPMVPVVFDYANRRMRIGPTLWAGESYEADLPIIQSYFAGVRGRKPGRMTDLGTPQPVKESAA